jgi:signal transduction histidine kinase
VTVSPLGAPEGNQGAICLFSDLTTVVELEQQLQLKEALARLGELAAGIAHEFRNGLATIHGYGRLMDPQAVPTQYKPYIEGIRQETEALRQVVTKFLEFARPESAAFSPVDLEAVVRRSADDLRHELPAGTTVALAGVFGSVQGDEVLLRQLFGNLIRNAAEACELAGVEPHISIGAHPDAAGRMAIVAVDDNGPGIAEADRARIFQPFFTTRARGSGLGLSIVQKITLHHNGRVTVDAAPGGGARVQIALPLIV